MPDIKNLIARAAIGEEYETIIRAEVNADDQMITKIRPNKIARTLIDFSSLNSVYLNRLKNKRAAKSDPFVTKDFKLSCSRYPLML